MLKLEDFTFVFYEPREGGDQDKYRFTLSIQSVMEDNYALFIWPSSKVLAQFIFANKSMFQNKRVIEMGAGTSLPGILAAACGAYVYLTDRDEIPIIKNMRTNFLTNNPVHLIKNDSEREPIFLDVKVVGFSWGNFNYDIITAQPFDYIIGADLFYDNSEDYDEILFSVEYFIRKNSNAKFITTYQCRSSQRSLQILLNKWGYNVETIPLPSFYPEHQALKETIELLIISKAQ